MSNRWLGPAHNTQGADAERQKSSFESGAGKEGGDVAALAIHFSRSDEGALKKSKRGHLNTGNPLKNGGEEGI